MLQTTDTIAAPPRAGGRLDALLAWLDDRSDLLSPIVVKEVRQIVRGREFTYSFIFSLLFALTIAFIGAAAAASGAQTTGRAVFGALTGCLAFLGFLIVPLGAFTALRSERLEQTMDLITVTNLPVRRVLIGKLLAQAVKLATLFAAMGPFVATSFLLGGIDFVSITTVLALVFLGSMWMCGAAIFASALARTRSTIGLVVIAVVVAMPLIGFVPILPLLMFTLGSAMTGGGGVSGVFFAVGPGFSAPGTAQGWWALAALVSVGAISLANLVLLAENRLSSSIEDKATALRIGFFIQFALIAAFFTAIWYTQPLVSSVVEPLATLCGLHLALVAAFTVTEDFDVSRRVQLAIDAPARWRWLNIVLRPGGGRGALYVLAQVAMLLGLVALVSVDRAEARWTAAICGYILFFTGVPTAALRFLRPQISSFRLRIAILLVLVASMVLPDLLYNVFWRPESFTIAFSSRHLLNPLRTLTNWSIVEREQWFAIPGVLATTGLLAYIAIIQMSAMRRTPVESSASDGGLLGRL